MSLKVAQTKFILKCWHSTSLRRLLNLNSCHGPTVTMVLLLYELATKHAECTRATDEQSGFSLIEIYL